MRIDDFEKISASIGFNEGINGKEEYFNSVVLVLLIPINGEYYFVLQKRSATIRQGGDICFPGGKIDKTDEGLVNTALRETTEELGILEEKIRIIGRLDTIVAPMGATVDAFIGITDITVDEIKINKDEVESLVLLPVSYFLTNEPERHSVQVKVHPSYMDTNTGEEVMLLPVEQLGIQEAYKKPWGNFKYGVYVYKTEYGVIWGITSRLIYDFVGKIQKLLV